MNKELQTIYVPVKVGDYQFKDNELSVPIVTDRGLVYQAFTFDFKQWEAEEIKILKPTTAIVLSKEEWENVQKCVEALEDIANPMKRIQSNAEKESAVVNVMMAIQLCKDGNWLSEKAKQALSQLK